MRIHAIAALSLLGGAAASPRPAPMIGQVDEGAREDLGAAFLTLEDEYTEAYNTWREAYSEANASFRAAAELNPGLKFEAPERVEPTFFPRFDRLATAGVEKAKLWCLSNYTSDASAEDQKRDFTRRAMGILMDPKGDHSKLPRIISSHSYGELPLMADDGRALLILVEAVATDPGARSAAAYVAASMTAPAGIDRETAASQKLAQMRSIAARYSGTGYGKRASGYVFGQENLQIGMIAPDILGKDVDGHDMKLSDFRGKITVIDFWGFW